MIFIDGNNLTNEQVLSVSRYGERVQLSEQAIAAIQKSRQELVQIKNQDKPVYGINTGFGIFADRRIPSSDSAALSRKLILSHAVGTGPNFSDEIVRAAILVRANTLSKGHSGVRLEIVQTLLELLNQDLTPIVPSQGSLGSSGDLCPLSHLALVITTDEKDDESESGWARYQGRISNGKEAMRQAGLQRIVLQAKEGLALNNGATFSAALGAMLICEARQLLDIADLSLAMSLEAMLGCSAAFDLRIHEARWHPGQMKVAQNVNRAVEGSTLMDAAGKVQDAYSLRCAPQVQGAARDTVDFVSAMIERELNAATDNPLIFDGDVLSGGNFHGEPVAMGMDYLGIAMSEVGAISERRIFRLTDAKLNNGLPPMLVNSNEEAGLNSGLMMPQYTAASLVLENQTLATPDSVHSLPTSAEQEDHNANSMTAARHAADILTNVTHILAIELYSAARAIDLRLRQEPAARMGRVTQQVYQTVRDAVPYQAGDAWWGPEIERVHQLIHDGAFLNLK